MKLKPLAGLLGMLLVTSPAYALTEVDTELQLLMDVSGSVSSSEFNLQLQGYVDAFYRHSAPDLGINLPIALTQYLQNDLLV
ncbi:DUF1194 domain-containing protein, partial [Aeromonas veronii]|uniref:DUF1194 domain-containing protein n=1 Tax=Aeromonas veronii TaxID=654 RepID=UPI003B9F363F